ncbi:MAG: membrane dipeptidase [Deltaproteobacteria bacterium]|nr:membrane dipeptidase [Deltaproteobacteria bacterium]
MLQFADARRDPKLWVASCGISQEAAELMARSDVIDLHLDSFIWSRIFGYDLAKRHGRGLLGARFLSQCDFPRVLEAGLTGATWIITTNPWRTARGRREAFIRNVTRLREIFAEHREHFQVVRNAREYREARAAGKHGAFIGIQGGNALDENLDALDAIPDDVVLRITLVHLTSSRIGVTSSPLKLAGGGLSTFGKDYVKRLDDKRIFVDLAHIDRPGFFDAVAAHDPSLPLIVTHTGVSGVYPHWRNLDDEQLRAVANTGGTIGVMYQASFLGKGKAGRSADAVLRHLAHIVDTVGEDHASLGSDWDGAIVAPPDIATCLEQPVLVQKMLERGWSPERIQKILAGNFLRSVAHLRG